MLQGATHEFRAEMLKDKPRMLAVLNRVARKRVGDVPWKKGVAAVSRYRNLSVRLWVRLWKLPYRVARHG